MPAVGRPGQDGADLREPELLGRSVRALSGRDSDLHPPGQVDFSRLRPPGGASSRRSRTRSGTGPDYDGGDPGEDDEHACEVLTFGRPDHCALGAPRYTSGRGRGGDGLDPGGRDAPGHRPRRVEAFALGRLRRRWDGGPADGEAVDSPAVAVSAATHHTLVATRSGRLYSFGLGRGGRLGTGDEEHRPLPTRVLGPLGRRAVAAVAAAENHSVCATADGGVYAWGNNG